MKSFFLLSLSLRLEFSSSYQLLHFTSHPRESEMVADPFPVGKWAFAPFILRTQLYIYSSVQKLAPWPPLQQVE